MPGSWPGVWSLAVVLYEMASQSPPAAFAASVLSALRPLRSATAEAFGAALRDAVAEDLHFPPTPFGFRRSSVSR